MLFISRYITASLGFIILGLGAWSWSQSNTITNLRAENKTQAQTIKNQEEANKALNIALQQERQAVIEQQQKKPRNRKGGK